MRRAGRVVVAAALLLSLAGCGGGKKQTTTQTTAPPSATTTIRVYFLRAGKVQPVLRTVASPADFPMVALAELTKGPTRSEQQALGLSSATSSPYTFGLDGVVKDHGTFTRPELAQIVYTITQYSTKVAAVEGKRYHRADFEDETPIILVESPLPFQQVKSPLHATGTANTFEATFQYDLVDTDGKVIKSHFVTATSGSGTRGTFDFTVQFTVGGDGPGKLVVYELSAKDGSRIHTVAIPIRLSP